VLGEQSSDEEVKGCTGLRRGVVAVVALALAAAMKVADA
jgi:hypothetical protein